mgnify:CR=1 FL=1
MSDTHAACMNFLNALEKIPEVIKSHQERADKLRVDLPTLQAIAARTWGKEDELKALKAELAALDRKITAALAPKKEEQDSVENKPASTVEVNATVVDAPSTSDDRKKTMVAEPKADYKLSGNSRRWAI